MCGADEEEEAQPMWKRHTAPQGEPAVTLYLRIPRRARPPPQLGSAKPDSPGRSSGYSAS